MSQAKVDKYKQEKYNRKKNVKKRNFKKIAAYVVATLIAIAFISDILLLLTQDFILLPQQHREAPFQKKLLKV